MLGTLRSPIRPTQPIDQAGASRADRYRSTRRSRRRCTAATFSYRTVAPTTSPSPRAEARSKISASMIESLCVRSARRVTLTTVATSLRATKKACDDSFGIAINGICTDGSFTGLALLCRSRVLVYWLAARESQKSLEAWANAQQRAKAYSEHVAKSHRRALAEAPTSPDERYWLWNGNCVGEEFRAQHRLPPQRPKAPAIPEACGGQP